MVTALWAIAGALVGLVTVLLLIWYHPARREPTQVEENLIAALHEANRLRSLEVLATNDIATAAWIWVRRYTRQKETTKAEREARLRAAAEQVAEYNDALAGKE